jgi:rSAM/selenodomain-associated transferase 2
MLTVVIPTLDPGPRFGAVLAALVGGAVEGVVKEVVIVDAGSADRTIEIAEAAGCRVLAAPKGRGGQMRAGSEAARGDWLLFLHADTVLQPGWPAAVEGHRLRHPDSAGYFRLGFDDPSSTARLWETGVALRCAVLGLPYGDQGLLISAAHYDEVGGFPDWPLMEDVEIAFRIGRRRLRRLDALAVTDAGKFRRDGWVRRSLRNLAFLTAWGMGVDPREIARRYV